VVRLSAGNRRHCNEALEQDDACSSSVDILHGMLWCIEEGSSYALSCTLWRERKNASRHKISDKTTPGATKTITTTEKRI